MIADIVAGRIQLPPPGHMGRESINLEIATRHSKTWWL
jgi:hypothetical protein